MGHRPADPSNSIEVPTRLLTCPRAQHPCLSSSDVTSAYSLSYARQILTRSADRRPRHAQSRSARWSAMARPRQTHLPLTRWQSPSNRGFLDGPHGAGVAPILGRPGPGSFDYSVPHAIAYGVRLPALRAFLADLNQLSHLDTPATVKTSSASVHAQSPNGISPLNDARCILRTYFVWS